MKHPVWDRILILLCALVALGCAAGVVALLVGKISFDMVTGWIAAVDMSKFVVKAAMAGIAALFVLLFLLASIITKVLPIPAGVVSFLKDASKFFIVMAMAAIGLNTDIVKLVKTGGKPIFMGFCCWVAIALVSLGVQHLLGIW